MRTIQALAPAKVNLTFDITGDLPGGYHEVETLMQAIDLQDEITLTVKPASAFSFQIECTNEIVPKSLPLDESNLMIKAARLFIESTKIDDEFELAISIEKNIPIGAGLAGGSTNGAAVLVAMNELFGRPLTLQALLDLGSRLGADVPFCITGGTAVGRHRGDLLQPLETALDLSYCIVKPRALSVSTPWAYQQYDQFKQPIKRPVLADVLKSMDQGNLQGAIEGFGNVFEPVIFAEYPELQSAKDQLLKSGCWWCQLSGSGPALFAIVADREQAHYIRRKVLKTDELEFDYVRLSMPDLGPPLEFYIAQTLSHGVSLKSTD